MKTIKKVITIFTMVLFTTTVKAQILISLLFGEALNTDQIEFGLAGGMSRSYLNDIEGSEGLNSFDLGFYFHIRMMEQSFLSTGVHVKSTLGATGMPTYQIGEQDFDAIYKDGTLTKKIPVYYVPLMWQQRFNNRLYIEAGPMVGILHQAKDVFEVSDFDGKLSYKKDVRDEYNNIDFGFQGGIGYKFKKELKSVSAGASYYYGLLDLSKNPDVTLRNSTFYFFVRIPMGLGKQSSE